MPTWGIAWGCTWGIGSGGNGVAAGGSSGSNEKKALPLPQRSFAELIRNEDLKDSWSDVHPKVSGPPAASHGFLWLPMATAMAMTVAIAKEIDDKPRPQKNNDSLSTSSQALESFSDVAPE